MSGKKPRASIAVPVYNGDNYVEYALQTALAQTYADFEIVISDNASTDRTEEICRRFVESDSRVHYYRSEVNRGVYWNFRRGLELPVPYCRHGALGQQRMSARDVDLLNRAVGQDLGLELHRPTDTHRTG